MQFLVITITRLDSNNAKISMHAAPLHSCSAFRTHKMCTPHLHVIAQTVPSVATPTAWTVLCTLTDITSRTLHLWRVCALELQEQQLMLLHWGHLTVLIRCIWWRNYSKSCEWDLLKPGRWGVEDTCVCVCVCVLSSRLSRNAHGQAPAFMVQLKVKLITPANSH